MPHYCANVEVDSKTYIHYVFANSAQEAHRIVLDEVNKDRESLYDLDTHKLEFHSRQMRRPMQLLRRIRRRTAGVPCLIRK
jgi:hypothetical protein